MSLNETLQQAITLHQAGRFAEAEELYLSVLKAEPRHPDANHNLGLMAMQLGKAEMGLPYLQAAWEAEPSIGQYWLVLTECLLEMGHYEEAQLLIEDAIRRGLESPQAQQLLLRAKAGHGNNKASPTKLSKKPAPHKEKAPGPQEINKLMALFGGGRYTEAAALAQTMTVRHPRYGFGWKALGAVLLQMGRNADALVPMQKAAALLPGDAEAHNNLSVIFMKLNRADEAEASCRRALQVKPDYAEAHNNLGSILKDVGRLEEAEASYRRALQVKPDYAEAHYNLGTTLKELGRLNEAEASYWRALDSNPDYFDAHNNLGFTLKELGRLEEAEACFHRALQGKPDLVEGRFNLAQVKKVKPGDDNLAVLAAIWEAAQRGAKTPSGKETTFLHFALGKCYDDTGDYDKAFPHFLEGNRLKRATFEYDPSQAIQLFSGIMRNLGAAATDRLRGGGDPSPLPVFVLGMPRSGTTLTEQIIASHPEVHGAGELHDFGKIMLRNIAGAAFPDNLHLLDRAQLTAWGAEYVAGLQRRAPDARRITDKLPGNFIAVGLIHLMLPNAKIIHVKRNPADTCLSCFTQLFANKNEFTYDLAELGQYYAGYARLMEHWREVLPEGAFLDVQYEDIVADQEAQSRRIIEYCGLEWSDACIDFHRNRRAVNTASVTQVRQPMYKTSVERWRHYEKFLDPLLEALGEFAPERRRVR